MHDLGHFLLGLEDLKLIVLLLICLLHPLQLVRWRHNISPQQTDPLDELTEDGRFAFLLLQALKKVCLRFVEQLIRDSKRMMDSF